MREFQIGYDGQPSFPGPRADWSPAETQFVRVFKRHGFTMAYAAYVWHQHRRTIIVVPILALLVAIGLAVASFWFPRIAA